MTPRPCPGCGLALEFEVETPPIPMTFESWFDPNGEGERLQFCPHCDEELPGKTINHSRGSGPDDGDPRDGYALGDPKRLGPSGIWA